MTLGEIASIVAVIASVIALLLSIRKAPHEENSLDAGAAKDAMEAASSAAKMASEAVNTVANLRRQMNQQRIEYENRLADWEKRFNEQAEELRKVVEENENLREWAKRLVHQVQALGGDPVKIRGEAK